MKTIVGRALSLFSRAATDGRQSNARISSIRMRQCRRVLGRKVKVIIFHSVYEMFARSGGYGTKMVTGQRLMSFFQMRACSQAPPVQPAYQLQTFRLAPLEPHLPKPTLPPMWALPPALWQTN